jgi:hypothetical protein
MSDFIKDIERKLLTTSTPHEFPKGAPCKWGDVILYQPRHSEREYEFEIRECYSLVDEDNRLDWRIFAVRKDNTEIFTEGPFRSYKLKGSLQ